ncbi:MAG TPA: hypothetical protein VIK55_02345 [Paludibacter sp.]
MKIIKSLSSTISFTVMLMVFSVSFSSCKDPVKDLISSEKKIISFYFLKTLNPALVNDTIFGTINETDHTVSVIIPQTGFNVTSLKASFTVTELTSIAIGNKLQECGITQNNFTSAQNYTVTALDGSTQTYVVTVTVQATAANLMNRNVLFSTFKKESGVPTDLSIYSLEI